jgi:Tol biopolymer transport system component
LWSRQEAGDADRELYTIPTTGGTPSRWRSWAGDDYRPRLSPGGDTVAFTSCATGDPTLCEVVIARTATGEIGALRARGCIRADPDWYSAPDGSRFLVFTQRSAGPLGDLVDHVVLANDAGTVLWAITPLGSEDRGPACCLDE